MTKLEKHGLLKYGCDKDFLRHMLGRLVSDCEYYLGFGNRCQKHLWTGDIFDQIILMKEIHDILGSDVDGWCPMSRIDEFAERFLS